MKNKYNKTMKKNRKIFSFAFLALAIFMVSCEIPSDPTKILELRLDTNIFTHKGYISITDLADQSNLDGTALKAKITLEGPNADIIVSEGGDFLKTGTSLDINDGIAAFAVNPKYRGFSEPINFSLEIYGDNYLTKTVALTITSKDSVTEVRQTVLNTKKVPSGVAVAQQSAVLSGGGNAAAVTVTTNTSTTNTAAEIVVPADNVFKDVNGVAISSGDLIAQVVYFDGNDEEASRSSTNSNVASLVDENGNTLTDVIIQPVATADINMSVGTTEVKAFDKAIMVSMDVSAELINPSTGEIVKTGDQFSIYSTSDNGNWAFESKGTLVSRNGKLVVDFETSHLSTFTLGTVINLCSQNDVAISLGNNAGSFSASYSAVFKDAQGAKMSESTAVKGTESGDTVLAIQNPPTESATLTLTGPTGLSVTTGLIDWCSGNANVSEATLAGLIPAGLTVDLNLRGKCSESSYIVPNEIKMKIEYTSGTGDFTDLGLIKKGQISIPGVILNKEYNLKVFYDGQSKVDVYTFD